MFHISYSHHRQFQLVVQVIRLGRSSVACILRVRMKGEGLLVWNGAVVLRELAEVSPRSLFVGNFSLAFSRRNVRSRRDRANLRLVGAFSPTRDVQRKVPMISEKNISFDNTFVPIRSGETSAAVIIAITVIASEHSLAVHLCVFGDECSALHLSEYHQSYTAALKSAPRAYHTRLFFHTFLLILLFIGTFFGLLREVGGIFRTFCRQSYFLCLPSTSGLDTSNILLGLFVKLGCFPVFFKRRVRQEIPLSLMPRRNDMLHETRGRLNSGQ